MRGIYAAKGEEKGIDNDDGNTMCVGTGGGGGVRCPC